jgi:hypothetical protein
MKRSIRLRGMNGPLKGRFWESSELLRVGRLEALEIVLDDSSVSRFHAEVRLTDRGWMLRDLRSTNGTRLNGERLGNGLWPLRSRDLLQFGEVAILVERVEPTAPEPMNQTNEGGVMLCNLSSFLRTSVDAGSRNQDCRSIYDLCKRLRISDRKLRLMVCAICRTEKIWTGYNQIEVAQQAVEVVEQYADNFASCDELDEASDRFHGLRQLRHGMSNLIYEACGHDLLRAIHYRQDRYSILLEGEEKHVWPTGDKPIFPGYVPLRWIDHDLRILEDIIGTLPEAGPDAFLLTIDPTWLTPTITALAQTAYEDRALPSGELDPARLAVLSDALEEVGCQNADILRHLRTPGPHFRGCWVLDSLLGKK